jgi:hypothetical protein
VDIICGGVMFVGRRLKKRVKVWDVVRIAERTLRRFITLTSGKSSALVMS